VAGYGANLATVFKREIECRRLQGKWFGVEGAGVRCGSALAALCLAWDEVRRLEVHEGPRVCAGLRTVEGGARRSWTRQRASWKFFLAFALEEAGLRERSEEMATAPWVKDVSVVEKELGVTFLNGLSPEEAEKRLEKFGKNELPKEEGSSFWGLVLEQFDDPLVKILLVAAVVSTLIAANEVYEAGEELTMDKFVEPLVILLILVLNAIVGVYQESNAEKSLEALKAMQPETARTLRGGAWVSELPAEDLVPGDIVELRVGDRVPADCRVAVLKTTTLRAEQSALTGESVSVNKTDEIIEEEDCELQSKVNMLFSGTALSNGLCIAIVTSTGTETEMGKINKQLQEASEERAEEKTPLKQKLEEFSDLLQYLISAVCVLVWLININLFVDFETWTVDFKAAIYYFQIAVALAVAAIPEGLPTVVTMTLALGTRKMSKRNCIVRKLPAVETLGCTTVICSDKTGTLTTNEMSVRQVTVIGAGGSSTETFAVSGSTYNPTDGAAELPGGQVTTAIERLAEIATVCNESTVELVNTVGNQAKWKSIGSPTESALTVAVEKLLGKGGKAQTSESNPLPANKRIMEETPKIATLEFTRDRKSMSVLVKGYGRTRSASNQLLVKGAPEKLLERCTHVFTSDGEKVALSDEMKEKILESIEEKAERALRCLGFAYKDLLGELSDMDSLDHPAAKQLRDPANFIKVEKDLTFVGLVAMQDPPRAEVRDSMDACRLAGIRVIVITGDNKKTAEAVCREINVFSQDEDISDKSFEGHEFSKFPIDKQKALLRANQLNGMVFSRAEPAFKQRIVKLLKEDNNVCAMTGDGVNDAPALKLADIGIAMGIAGTEVAKESSDMVLADDNFSTIVASVEEGRSIYENMKAFIRYMISSNIGEVFSIFFVAALGMPEGLIPIQLLWVNLVTDGPPATALGFNPADPDSMKKPPRDRSDPLISKWLLLRYLIVGLYVGVATVGVFLVWFTHGVGSEPFLGLIPLDEDSHSSVSYTELVNWKYCDTTTNVFSIPGKDPYKFSANSWTAGSQTVSLTGCDYFSEGKTKASTLSLSVLVTIEMFNALNAISEDGSLFAPGTHPFVNPYLLLAMASSFILHFFILYVDSVSPMFEVVPLSFKEWMLVIAFSAPVIIIDEVLKFIGRQMNAAARRRRQAKLKAE